MNLSDIIEPLLNWYEAEKRDLPWRVSKDPYRIWISEIMLQQTRVEAVKGYFARFLTALPDVSALAGVPEQQLLKLWEGLGYYNRARNLQKAAQQVMERFQGVLPENYEDLLTLPGIGSYTAGAVASIAFGKPVPAVDGNVLRVLSRLTANYDDIADPKTKRAAEDTLRAVMPAGRCGEFNQSLMELGAVICVPNGPPDCGRCPLAGLCEAKKRGTALELPVKSAKKPRRIEQHTILLLVRDDLLAIRRRKGKGLLAGLWELPSAPGMLTREQAVSQARTFGLEPLRAEELCGAKHIFTHVEWQMTGWRVTVAESSPMQSGLIWAKPEQLREEYPLPAAFRAYLAPFLEENPESSQTSKI
ncbi:A/G-specific adenine glycosylase [Marasmitruncus massiliensis]|uniref:A/G-specific adenine glycosylase n=1 Tax=Marasmitruncus massiliensis TaxID=1944642 RepID=UPI000C7DA63D|nr:A/G-specific adenine glycosylase [Marasmitruncus massiliensis]